MFGQTLKESRNSNTFKSMLESRSKSPTTMGMGENSARQSSTRNNFSGLRSSHSTQSLLGGFGKLRDSRNLQLG